MAEPSVSNSMETLDQLSAEWNELSNEYKNLEVYVNREISKLYNNPFFIQNMQGVNNNYLELLEKLEQLQQRCTKDIQHQRYRLSQINTNLKK